MREIYYTRLSKSEKLINWFIIIVMLLCFILGASNLRWGIVFILLLLTLFKKKDEFLREKNQILLKKMIVVDNEDNMYIIYNTQNGVVGMTCLMCFIVIFMFGFDSATLTYFIAFIGLVFVNVNDLIELANQVHFVRNIEAIHTLICNKNKYVRKITNISSYREGIYVIETTGLNENDKRVSSTFLISKKYENYEKLISKINLLCNN